MNTAGVDGATISQTITYCDNLIDDLFTRLSIGNESRTLKIIETSR